MWHKTLRTIISNTFFIVVVWFLLDTERFARFGGGRVHWPVWGRVHWPPNIFCYYYSQKYFRRQTFQFAHYVDAMSSTIMDFWLKVLRPSYILSFMKPSYYWVYFSLYSGEPLKLSRSGSLWSRELLLWLEWNTYQMKGLNETIPKHLLVLIFELKNQVKNEVKSH